MDMKAKGLPDKHVIEAVDTGRRNAAFIWVSDHFQLLSFSKMPLLSPEEECTE